MILLHKSLEMECDKYEKDHNKCENLLKEIQRYNKLRTKHCYE